MFHPICQSGQFADWPADLQIGQPIYEWDDQSENLFEVLFSKFFNTYSAISHLTSFKLMVSTEVSHVEYFDIRHKL